MRANIAVSILLAGIGLVINPVSGTCQGTGGYALSFDGADDLVVVSNSPLLELTSGTLEGWFRPDWSPGSLSYDPVLIANQLGPALTRYSLQLDRNLTSVILANGYSTSKVAYAFTRGTWVHLAIVASGSAAQVYVNGLLAGTTTNGFGTLVGLPLNLGSDGASSFFAGQMDEVRIWNSTRSATDIRYNVSRALTGNEPGLVAYWRMAEGIGLTANDATTNGLNGALSGPTWTNSNVFLVNTTGSFGTALDFSSSRSGYVQVQSSPSLALSNQFSFEAWIKPRTAQCNTILARGDGSSLTNTDYIFQVGTDGTNCGVMKLALMVAGNWTTSISSVPLNAWTHVAVTYDGAMCRFYINGLLDAAVATTGSVYQSGSPLLLGRQGLSGGNYFDGTMDEVRVWNTVRSGNQIQTNININRTLSASQPGLIGYWRFDEQSGVGVFDASGFGNRGAIMNPPLRLPSFWAPVLSVNGANPSTLECHASWSDPGATITGAPVAISAGDYSALALRADGSGVGWGYNFYGQINVPTAATDLIALSTSFFHGLALRSDGTVLGFGANTYGQINIPPAATNVIAVAASGGISGGSGNYPCSLALKSDGSLTGWGSDQNHQLEIPTAATNVVAIAASAGGAHCLALTGGGVVLGWGDNTYGQASPPPNANGAIAIAAGGFFSLALKPNGTVVAWGRNDAGQTNVPASAQNAVAIAAGGFHGLALRYDGSVVSWGGGEPSPPAGATNIIAIAAGDNLSVALRADGTILAWGDGAYGGTTPPTNANNLSLALVTRGSVDSGTPGHYAISYSAANAAGGISTVARTVIVADTTPPVLILVGPNPLTLTVGAPFSDPGATATDACAGDLTGSIVRTGSVTNSVPGTYTLTYTVTDPSGNSATTNRTVLVTGPPVIVDFNAFFSGTNVITGSPVVQFLATVNPGGLPTSAFAQYGLTTAYPGRTATVSLPASYNNSTFFVTLDGLLPGVTYHFRITATNSFGSTYGPDQTFTVPMVFGPGDLNGDGHVSQSELLSVVSNFFATSGQGLLMTSPKALGHGIFQFGLTNDTGWNFSVQVSTNLVDWSPLPVNAQPVWQFLDPGATNQPRRFYRIHSP